MGSVLSAVLKRDSPNGLTQFSTHDLRELILEV